MSYSCTDFVDDILEDFAQRKLIDRDAIPDDDPRDQYCMVSEAMEQQDERIAALVAMLQRMVVAVDDLTDGQLAADCASEREVVAAREAAGKLIDAKPVPITREAANDEAEDAAETIIQTTCKHCQLDIEGCWADGDWRDRGNNTHCPDWANEGSLASIRHEPEGS